MCPITLAYRLMVPTTERQVACPASRCRCCHALLQQPPLIAPRLAIECCGESDRCRTVRLLQGLCATAATASATRRHAFTPVRRTCWTRESHHACWPRPPPAPGGNIQNDSAFLIKKKRKTSCEVADAVLGLPPKVGCSGGCITAPHCKSAHDKIKMPPSARPCTSQQPQKGKSPSHPIDEVVLNGAMRVEVLWPQDILRDLLRLVLRVLR